jgi:hypothetical protein
MYEKTDKRRLYWLIDMYLSGKIDAPTFNDEFYYCYSQELDYGQLTGKEEKEFDKVSNVAGRYSPYEEDHKLNPKAFFTEEQLKQTVESVQETLKAESPLKQETSEGETDKRQLYWLMDSYLLGKITASLFKEQFYHYYLSSIDLAGLTRKEAEAFKGLNRIVRNFSPYEQDHKANPGVFFTEQQLKQAVIETKEKLKEESPV